LARFNEPVEKLEPAGVRTRRAVIFVETKRWVRRPREEYYGILSAADDASAPVSAKSTGPS
jgi:hypothetical protein